MVAILTAALLIAGCGAGDGRKELAEGWAAYGVHDLKKADKLFTKSVACDAGNVDALVASARVKLDLGEITAAKAVLAQAAARAGADDDVILLGAQIAYHAKDYKAAAQAYAKFAADATREAKLRAEAHVGYAVVEMTCNEHEGARVALLKALLLDRRNAPARYHLGLLYRTMGYEAAALEQFEAYAMLEKEDAVHVQRVQRQIIPALKEAIARKAAERPGVEKRDSATAAKNIQNAEAEWKKGNFKKAKAWYADALKADPLSHPAALGLAKALEKTDATATGVRNALACYQTASQLKPGSVTTLLTVARLAGKTGNAAVATEAYTRALAFDPRNVEALDGMIRSLRRAKSKSATLWQGYRDLIGRK